MIGRTGIKPHGTKERTRAILRPLSLRLPELDRSRKHVAIIALMFLFSVALGAGLGRCSSQTDLDLSGGSDYQYLEVNRSPVLGLGGSIDALLFEDDPYASVLEETLEEQQAEGNLKKQFYVITARDSIYNALQCYGVDANTIKSWITIAKPHYDLARLKPGQSFWLYLDPDKRPVRFEFEIDRGRMLVIERDAAGYVARMTVPRGKSETEKAVSHARSTPGWVDPKTGYRYYEGWVKDSFYQAAIRSGMTPAKVMALIRVFAGTNFDREVKPGDHFRVLIAPGAHEGEEGPILAAMVEAKHKPRYRFRVEQGKTVEYCNERGMNSPKPAAGFIAPVRGARISSRYSLSRFHPILHTYRPHQGVDYAARAGSPVRAAANGTVTFVGRKGGYGRVVIVKHGSMSSQYAHLSGFAPGIKSGKTVKQGTVVGYVGSSGLSTGPHLDYRLYKNGAAVNPAKVTKLPAAPATVNRAYIAARDRFLPELKRKLPFGPPQPWSPPEVVAKAEPR